MDADLLKTVGIILCILIFINKPSLQPDLVENIFGVILHTLIGYKIPTANQNASNKRIKNVRWKISLL